MEIAQHALNFFQKIKSDLVFALILLVCFLCSLILRKFARTLTYVWGTWRALDGLIGFILVIVATRGMFLCSFVIIFAHLALYKWFKDPVLLNKISFYGTFAYLALLRVMHFIGLPPLVYITNGVQLIVTLRVIGLSYEISDCRIANLKAKIINEGKNKSENESAIERIIREPTTFEAFNYLYGFIGLFTEFLGPYYTFQTYIDSNVFGSITTKCAKSLIYEKLSKLYWSFPLLLVFSWLDPVNVLRNEEVSEYNILSLFVWSALAFIYFRMRIYTAWMISESICITAGIGVYPIHLNPKPGIGIKGFPENMKQDSKGCRCSADTISNLDIPRIEHSDGFRSGMRAWNRTVQFWLANFVYKRSSKNIRLPYTMLVSAFWHGIHPGYFLSFLTIPLCTFAEDILFEAFPAETRPRSISILWSFIRMRGFEFMACGFLLLTWSDTIRLWTNLYLWLHVTMAFTIIFTKSYLIICKKNRNTQKKAE